MFDIATNPNASAGLGMAACDASGRLTFLSATLQELLGQAFVFDDAAEPGAAEHLYEPDGVTRLGPEHLPLARARRGEVVTDAVICHRSEGQDPTYLRCNAAPVTASDGTVTGAELFVEDVTAENVGVQSHQQTYDHLISTLNHELRTPLTKLLGHAELLEDMHGQLPVNAVHSLEKVRKAAEELQELADLVSSMADLDTPGELTEARGETADVKPELVPEQWHREGSGPSQRSRCSPTSDGTLTGSSRRSPR